jgi:hypothetical protein
MSTSGRLITIAVSVALQDAGEATRSLEIMRGIREMAPDGYKVRGLFFSHGSKFDQNVLENGFEIRRVDPSLEGEGYLNNPWGAGIRIPAPGWNKRNIIAAIRKVTTDSSYKENAVQLGRMMSTVNGQRETANVIWKFITNQLERYQICNSLINFSNSPI